MAGSRASHRRVTSGTGTSPVRIAGVGAVLASLGLLVASETVLRADREVLYTRPEVRSHCGDAAGRTRCWASARFVVANNGRVAQDDVRIAWLLDPRRWQLDCQAGDLVGSARPTRSPRLVPAAAGDGLRFEVRDFVPNTLLECRLHCVDCTPDEVRRLGEAHFALEGAGIVEGDPRATAFRRFFVNLARLASVFTP